jgi:hypothetical protein
MPTKLVKKTKPWFGGRPVGFIISKPVTAPVTAQPEAPDKKNHPPINPNPGLK